MLLSGRYVSHFLSIDVTIPLICTTPFPVVCAREPPRRACRLCAPRDLLASTPIQISPHFPQSTYVPPNAVTCVSAARNVRAGVFDNGRERRPAVGMLQDTGLALHLRGHPARGAPARDERAVCVRATPKLQRRRARRRGHAARTLWPGLLVGAGGLV